MKNDKSKLKINIACIVFICFFNFLFFLKFTNAASLVESLHCGNAGDCQLNNFVFIAIWVWNWILGISGSLTLLFFIYGGFTFLISGGSSERVTKGKTILINSIIGLVIIFTSYMIVGFVLKNLGYNRSADWFSIPSTYQGY
jgi:hypothetical protein